MYEQRGKHSKALTIATISLKSDGGQRERKAPGLNSLKNAVVHLEIRLKKTFFIQRIVFIGFLYF